MKRSVWRALGAGSLLGLSVLGGCGKATSPPVLGGETHWLEECGQGAALPKDGCGSGLACLCGTCTAACSDDAGCDWLSADAICVETDTTARAGACAAGEPPRLCVSTMSTPDSATAQASTGNPLSLTPTLPGNWACLDESPPEPDEPDPNRDVVTFSVVVADDRTLQQIPEVSLRACSVNDRVCEAGIAQGTTLPPASPGLPPAMTVQLPVQFQGFLRLTAPGYVLYDYYIGGPMLQDVIATQPFLLVSESYLLEIMQGLGVAAPSRSAGLGMLRVQVLDCNLDPAPGVELRLSDQDQPGDQLTAQAWANQARIPVLNAPTDDEGIAGFIDLPTENFVFEAVVNGRTFGSRTFPISPNRLTTGTIRVNYDVGY